MKIFFICSAVIQRIFLILQVNYKENNIRYELHKNRNRWSLHYRT